MDTETSSSPFMLAYAKRVAHKGIWVEPKTACGDRVPGQVGGG